MPSYRVSIDIGGTFTDLLALNEETGELSNIKISSTPRQPSDAVLRTLREFLSRAKPREVVSVTHATTVAVNALLGQIGFELPKTALLTTRGFRDIIEIGRQRRPELYSLSFRKPRPLIPRMYRYEVSERIGAEGEELEQIDENEVAAIGEALRREDIKSVAVGFINSYIQPSHELEAGKCLEKIDPDLRVTLSHVVIREYREYERISTAVVNACLMPIISSYIQELTSRLRTEAKVESPFMIMQSNGGIASGKAIMEKPVTIIESGPAAGVIAASFYSRLLGIKNILSFDMGGTTAKAGIIRDGTPGITSEYEVGGKIHSGRITKGSGYPVRFPFIDLVECGAGGGTLAWVDEGGGLQLGPMSAGADPGPACYGRGGEKPTVTDANVVLGRLNPKYLLGGQLEIHRDLAEKSVRKWICEKARLDLIKASSGIIRIAVSEINKIMRIVSIERGIDPRSFTLIAFGGAGPMHACLLAEELSVSQVVIPLNPGLFSALGLVTADYVHHDSRPLLKKVTDAKPEMVETLFTEMEQGIRKILVEEGVDTEHIVFERRVDARYSGQAYELQVNTVSPFNGDALREVDRGFHLTHQSLYGYSPEDEEVELVNLRVSGRGITGKPVFPKKTKGHRENPREAITSLRLVHLDEEGNGEECPIYEREKLVSGDVLHGPAIVEQYDSTTVVFHKWECEVDEFGNLRLRLGGTP
ncbi:MAG: hydantoinase/oxoprolinase family protein [Promethearchaeati archaeon SRVP18_Atabeyarchaeia-1]